MPVSKERKLLSGLAMATAAFVSYPISGAAQLVTPGRRLAPGGRLAPGLGTAPGLRNASPPGLRSVFVPPGRRQGFVPPGKRTGEDVFVPPGTRNPPGSREPFIPPGRREDPLLDPLLRDLQ